MKGPKRNKYGLREAAPRRGYSETTAAALEVERWLISADTPIDQQWEERFEAEAKRNEDRANTWEIARKIGAAVR